MNGICATPGCGALLPPQAGRGRRRIFCSPACRARGQSTGGRLVVEIDHEPVDNGVRPAGRIWLVRLRRGPRHVVIASGLGRPSADHLAGQLTELMGSARATERTME